MLAKGAIGTPRAVQCTLARQFLDPNDIRNDPERGGGALYDIGSYTISSCSAIFGGAPRRVIAAIDRDPAWKIDRFSRYLRGEEVPCWPIEYALTTLSIIEALFASATLGRWQDIAD